MPSWTTERGATADRLACKYVVTGKAGANSVHIKTSREKSILNEACIEQNKASHHIRGEEYEV